MSRKKLVQHYEKLLEQDPTNISLLQKLAAASQAAGELEKAADALAGVAQGHERDGFFLKAVALLKQCLKVDPSRNDFNFRLADLHLTLGLLREAVAYLQIGLTAALAKGDRAASFLAARKLVEADPDKPEFRLYFAQFLVWGNRKGEARAELAAAAQLLQEKHPDLAARTTAVDLGDGVETTRDELSMIEAIRFELHSDNELAADLLLLNFDQPN